MIGTLSIAFFVIVLVFAGFTIGQSFAANIGLIRAKFSKHRAVQRSHIVMVTIRSMPGFVPAPPPVLGAAARAQPVFGAYIAGGFDADRRLVRGSDGVAPWKSVGKVAVKTGTYWHRPYLPRPIAVRSDYRFVPCMARRQPMQIGAMV